MSFNVLHRFRGRSRRERFIWLALLGLLVSAVEGVVLFGDDLVLIAITATIGLVVVLTVCLSQVVFLRWLPKEGGSTVSEPTEFPRSAREWSSRMRVYAVMAAVTAISTIYQAFYLDVQHRPFAASRATVFLGNIGLFVVVVVIVEFQQWRRRRRCGRRHTGSPS
jgi:amino acid permease